MVYNVLIKGAMGNNHDKYFGKDRRKILILGFPGTGKTTILEAVTKGKERDIKSYKAKELTIKDAKLGPLTATFFDLAGGQRQRVFWKQHYEGSQGVIFVISCLETQQNVEKQLKEINKVSQFLKGIPYAICLNKADLASDSQTKELQNKVKKQLGKFKIQNKIFRTEAKSGKGLNEMLTWLLKETKAL